MDIENTKLAKIVQSNIASPNTAVTQIKVSGKETIRITSRFSNDISYPDALFQAMLQDIPIHF